MDVTQIYATAAGGFFVVFILANLLPRTVRLREKISLLTSKHLTYPYFLNRHRLFESVKSNRRPSPADLHYHQCFLSQLSSVHDLQGWSPSGEPIARQHDSALYGRSSRFSGRPPRLSAECVPTRSPFGGINDVRAHPFSRARHRGRPNLFLVGDARTSIWTDNQLLPPSLSVFNHLQAESSLCLLLLFSRFLSCAGRRTKSFFVCIKR